VSELDDEPREDDLPPKPAPEPVDVDGLSDLPEDDVADDFMPAEKAKDDPTVDDREADVDRTG